MARPQGKRFDDSRFAEHVEDVASGKSNWDFVPVCRMPAVLRWLDSGNVPLPDLPVIIRSSVIRKAREKHQIPVAEIQRLPGQLRDPLMIFRDGPRSVLILTELSSAAGDVVVAAVHLQRARQDYRVNDIASLRRETLWRIFRRIEDGELAQLPRLVRRRARSQTVAK